MISPFCEGLFSRNFAYAKISRKLNPRENFDFTVPYSTCSSPENVNVGCFALDLSIYCFAYSFVSLCIGQCTFIMSIFRIMYAGDENFTFRSFSFGKKTKSNLPVFSIV